MGKLDGKVAIVTGAARGLGRAYAKRLAGLGAKVAVADVNLRSYEEFEAEASDMTADTTVAEIEASGGTALGIEVDVRDHEAVDAMVARVVQEWGRVDVLVANAGGGRGRPMDTKASTPRSDAPTACHGDEPVRDRLFLQCRRPDHERAGLG
jgi:3-oxoacyl-[acyl-carrier protein] reductase